MGSLTALLLATPIFGFSLQLQATPMQPTYDISARMAAEVAGAEGDGEQGAEAEQGDGGREQKDSEQAKYIADLKRRDNIAGIHRAFGIATWASMTVTVALGVMSYYNLYGFGAGIGDNPCVKGSAIGGDGGCDTMRGLHGASAALTTALYATTFTLSLLMPDPDDLASGKGEFASKLRLHKTLRWVHLGGMIAQALLGIVIANNLLGLDRANDYGTLQALATVHLATGLITYGALTWAGALMTF